MQKSSVPISHGYPNKYFLRVQKLIEHQRLLKDCVGKVKAVGDRNKSGLGYDIKGVLKGLESTDVKAQLREVWEMMRTGETNPVMGPPPRPNTLYGRFGDGLELLDIGSGNCSKLGNFTGSLKITVCDAKPIDTKHVVKKLDGPIENNLDRLGKGQFLTSFMSLTQIDPETVKLILQYDGLHLIPDFKVLVDGGIAQIGVDGKATVRTLKGPYIDNVIELPGYSPRLGYKLCPTYEAVTVRVELSVEVSQTDDVVIDATPSGIEDVNYNDVTYKYDGVPYELELYQGQAYYTSRNGQQRVGLTGFQQHMCLHLEELAEVLVLIRVLSYKGMIPPHSGECLRLFAEKVKVIVDGKKVVGPEVYNPRYDFKLPIDGLISRREEKDYYFKPYWTVDIYGCAIEKYRNALLSKGFVLHCDPQEGFWEYLIERDEATVAFRPLKPRVDKTRATSVETVIYLLEKKTLAEMEALMGSPWIVTE